MYKRKYFQNIYRVCIYIHNKYTRYTHNENKNLSRMWLIVINRLTALIIIIHTISENLVCWSHLSSSARLYSWHGGGLTGEEEATVRSNSLGSVWSV